KVLINLLHRGACGCEPNTGDGAGILLQMPDKFLRKVCAPLGLTLPAATEYGAGLTFLPRDYLQRDKVQTLIQTLVVEEGQRFSTNTFPSWPLAHPYRFVAHNGEINTLRGNINWMRAREALCRSDVLGEDLAKVFPVTREGLSDSATFDNVLEFLVMSGRSLPHAILMMIPEPWQNHESMSPERRAFYEYHASLMEPWDGPASIAF